MLAVSKVQYQRQLWSLLGRLSFSTSTVEKPRIERIITKVDNDVRRNGRIFKRDVDSALEIVRKIGFVQPSHSLVLLRCCGSLLCELKSDIRNELVDDVWATIKARNVKLDVSHYNALLNVYNENNKSFNPADLLAEMESNSIEPNRVTYQRLLHRYCQIGDIEGALKILEHMKSKELPLTEAIFNSLIMGYSRAGDMEACMAVINQMENANIDITNNTIRILLSAICENIKNDSNIEQKLNEALKILREKDVQMTDKDWLDIISTVAKVDEKSPLIDTFMEKCNQTAGYNHECLITIMELINERKLDTALKLLFTMRGAESAIENGNFGNFFVTHLVDSGVDREMVINVCDNLRNKGVNSHCYSKVAEKAFQVGDLENSKHYLDIFLEKTGQHCKPHFVWPLLVKCKSDDELLSVLNDYIAPIAKTSSFNSIVDTFIDYVWPRIKMDKHIFIERCKEFGLSDITLVTSLFKHKLVANKLDEAAKMVNDERYFHRNLLTNNVVENLSNAYINTGDIDNTVVILKKFSAAATTRDPVGLCLLRVLQRHRNDVGSRFVPLLNALKDNNVFISSSYAEAINESEVLDVKEKKLVASLVNDFPDESITRQETSSVTIEDLEKQYADLCSRGILARGTLRQLVMAYCRKQIDTSTESGKAQLQVTRERIEQLLNEFLDSSGSFTKALRALLLSFYTVKCEDLDAALKIKNMDDLSFDSSKLISLARLMVSKGKVEDAIKLLKEEATKEREHLTVIPKVRLEPEIIRMANIAGEVTKDSAIVKQLLDAAVDCCKVKITHLMLEPIIKVHILNNDFKKAIEDYKHCVDMYSCAPATTELMVQALNHDDSDNLQTITDISNSVQGDHNTLFDLGIALIRSGKIKQAKKVMNTAGLRISERHLKLFSYKCVKENSMDILEQAIPLLKNVFDVNLDELYYDLVRGYAKAGNVEKVQEIWTQMQEDNFNLSDRTIRFLTSFLAESGKDISVAAKN